MSKNSLVVSALQDGTRGVQTTRAVCPFCVMYGHATRKKNLTLDRATGKWFCFRCHKLGHLDGWEADEAAVAASRSRGKALPVFDPPAGWLPIGERPTAATSTAYAYARSRGIKPTAIAQTQMGVSTSRPLSEDEQDFRNRIIIPILDADNTTWLGYVGRTLGKSNLTYMYKRGMFRGEILYNQKQVYIETEEPLLVVEGTLDVAYVWPNAVATLGTWSEAQVQILREARRPVAVVLDGDAWRKGEALSMKLKLYGVRAGFVRLPPTLDPDDVESDWLQDEIRKCLTQ